jgi:hypothetical protein
MPRLSSRLPRDAHNASQGPERKAFSVEMFGFRNSISRSQVFKEIAAGRLIANKVASRTIITEQAEKAWQRALPRAVPPTLQRAQHQQSLRRAPRAQKPLRRPARKVG